MHKSKNRAKQNHRWQNPKN